MCLSLLTHDYAYIYIVTRKFDDEINYGNIPIINCGNEYAMYGHELTRGNGMLPFPQIEQCLACVM